MARLYGTEVRKYYIIAALPRTGSFLLCDGLEATGILGCPVEPIAPQNKPIYSREWGIDPKAPFLDYLAMVVRQGTTPNGVFGTKIHWNQIEWGREQANIGEANDQRGLDELFPDAQFIHMIRNDVRGQAISAYRAYYTDEWFRMRGQFSNPTIIRPDPPCNSKAIRYWEKRFSDEHILWQKYFEARGIAPLQIEYEDLANDWKVETRRCLEYLGEDPAASERLKEPNFLRQADAVSRAWRRRLDEEDQ